MITLKFIDLIEIVNSVIEELDDKVIFDSDKLADTLVTLAEVCEDGCPHIKCAVLVPKK